MFPVHLCFLLAQVFPSDRSLLLLLLVLENHVCSLLVVDMVILFPLLTLFLEYLELQQGQCYLLGLENLVLHLHRVFLASQVLLVVPVVLELPEVQSLPFLLVVQLNL
uniref:Uncharacterized protein n=1 Tax=Panstrongylus lignarius TaxID=156445 RepID=A0A224Y143_9HEMI